MLLFLFLILSAWVPVVCDAAESFSVLTPHNPISAQVGSTVVLPCWLSPSLSVESMDIRWHRSPSFKITVLHYREGQLQGSSQDPQFIGRAFLTTRRPDTGGLKGGDVSLRLENVTLKDDGEFQCYVSSDRHYERASVAVSVMVPGTPPLLSVHQANDSLLNVSCASSGWHPQPKLTWSNSQGMSGLAPSVLLYSPGEQGLVSAYSWILTSPSDSGWLSCSVHLSGGEEREGRVALLGAPYPASSVTHTDDQSGQWRAAFIALLILGLLATLIITVLHIRKKARDIKLSVENPEEEPLLQIDSKKVMPKIIDINEATEEKVDVRMDEDTAHLSLKFSKNGKIVRDSLEKQEGRDTTKRFTHHLFVLGKEGFNSGRAYWEVGLWNEAAEQSEKGSGLKKSWSVGVVSESAERNCDVLTPSEGYWVLSSDKDNGLLVNTVHGISLCEKPRPKTLGVFLDYDKNMISFYNVEEKSHMLTLFTEFHGKVYPLFGPGKGDKVPLVLIQESNVNSAENSNDNSQSSPHPTALLQPTTSDSTNNPKLMIYNTRKCKLQIK